MKEETKIRKREKIELLSDIQRKSREIKRELQKCGYNVEIISSDKSTSKELTYFEIYNYETYVIREKSNRIFCSCDRNLSFPELKRFSALVNKYKRKYGLKNLHEHTKEIVYEIRKGE